MLPAREVTELVPFPDILENQELPVTLEVGRGCKVDDKIVLEEGQIISVIDRSNIDVLCGRDWNNRKIRLGKTQVIDYQVDIVEELYPKNIEELKSMVTECSFIQTKAEFKKGFNHFEKFETFQFTNFLDDTDNKGVAVVSQSGMTVLDSELLLDSNSFVLVRIKNGSSVKDFIKNFKPEEPPTVCFRDLKSGTVLPLGNVTINSVANYGIAYTVTTINEGRELKYETFPIDRRMVFRRPCLEKNPRYVRVFGAYNSIEYREKLKEIKSVMNYEFQSPRFYAFLIIENHCYIPHVGREGTLTPNFQRPAHLDLKTSVYSSIRKGIFKLTKRSPSSEDLNVKFKRRSLDTLPNQTKTELDSSAQTGAYEHIKLAPRSSSDPITPPKTLQSAENLVYNIDTLFINEIKSRNQEKVLTTVIKSKEPQNNERKRIVKPTRPISFENKMIFPMDSINLDNEEYEAPFREQSPFGLPTHIKDENIPIRAHRSPSAPVRTVAKPIRQPFTKSQSVSPPSRSMLPFFEQDGLDSGVDSPDEAKQVLREFQEANKGQFRKRSELFGSDLEISLPYNYEHLTRRPLENESRSPMYDIPRRRLHESLNFPNLKRMELKRCRSESALDDNNIIHEEAPVYAEPNYEDIRGISRAEISSQQRQELDSISKIKAYSIEQMVQLLMSLNLRKYVSIFERELLNGAFVLRFSEQMLSSELEMTAFEARKLYKYIHGWRPIAYTKASSSPDEIKSMDRKKWGYVDVQNQLQLIKLPEFGKFCYEHFIDGTLLLDLQHNNLVPTLKDDGIELTKIEMLRLEGYLNKDVLYEQDGLFLG